jgi:GMP synthase (glutamine-hydrolysing)
MTEASRARRSRKRPILAILRQEASTPGRAGKLLNDKGFELDIRRPVCGDPLPETLAGHAGVISFGGPMSANDPDEHIKREIEWLKVPLRENRPYLGICLGAQMLAKSLGCAVEKGKDDVTEIGWYPIKPTAEGKDIMPKWPGMVYHFHMEGFELPKGAVLLAEGDVYPNQAYRYGEKAWGIQYHPELTLAMQRRWAVKGAHRFHLPNAQQGHEHLRGRVLHDKALREWFGGFLNLVFTEA